MNKYKLYFQKKSYFDTIVFTIANTIDCRFKTTRGIIEFHSQETRIVPGNC